MKKGEWDLSDLAKNPKHLEQKISILKSQVQKFRKQKLSSSLSSAAFNKLLSKFENLIEQMYIIWGYPSLDLSTDTQSSKAGVLMTKVHQEMAHISNQLLAFDLWWKKLDNRNAKRLLAHVKEGKHYLQYQRLFAKYTLSEPEEKIINTLEVTGASAIVKLYDTITGKFEYVFKGKKLTREELSNYVRSPKASERKKSYQLLLDNYQQHSTVLGEIYQTRVHNWADKGIKLRGYHSPISIRNLANDVDDKTVSTLLDVCRKNTKTFQQFFSLKKKLVGLSKMQRYDLYTPLGHKDKKYTYQQALKQVLDSMDAFSPQMKNWASTILNKNHLHWKLSKGKRDGAYCHGITPRIPPYVFVNFTGKTRDVYTLAHELGHGIHAMAASHRSILEYDAPLPLAETASTFSELLLYDHLLEQSPGAQKTAIAEKIEDIYATVGRQSFFVLFEIEAHKSIAKQATVEDLSKLYLKNLQHQFGRAVNVSSDFSSEWSCIPHFYHTPFYCYAYAFGNLLALSLYQTYKKEGKSFAPHIIDIFAAGGSQKPEQLLAKQGMNIQSPSFWKNGFAYINQQVKLLKRKV